MTIKELRLSTRMTQREFAGYFNIPLRTIENWETGKRNPPEYVVELIRYKIEKEDLLMKLVELNEGARTELTSGTLQEIVEYLKTNPGVYEWQNDNELETQTLMGEDRYQANLVELELDNIETLRELECELNKLDLGWWRLEIE